MSGGVKKIAQVAVGAVVGFVQGGPIGAAIGAGLAFYAASQQEALTNNSSVRASEPSAQTVRSSKAPIRFILGRVSTGGVLVWAQEQSGAQGAGEWVHLVYVLSEGPVSRLEDIFLGQESISKFGDDATYELVINPTTVNAFLKTNCPDWKDTQIGRGLSYVRLSLRYNAEKFPSGIPDVRFVVRGRDDIYDPRTGASGYTQNTALHILWYLRTRCGVPDDEIVFSTFASAANVCDELVTNADGTSSKRYTTACVIAANEQRTQVIQKLEASCAGKLIRVGGRWMLQAGAYYGPYDFEITEDMVIGTIKGGTESTNDAAINTVRGTFIDTTQAWAETDYPEVVVSQWLVEDGGEAAETLSYPYVTDAYQPQRLANIELRRRRAGGAISIPMNFAGYNCRPGRVVRVNLPSLNILGEFIVTNWAMGAKEGCTVSVAQYEQAIFDDAVGQPYNPLGFINLPSGGLGAPTGAAWSAETVAEVIQGVLSWAPPTGIVTEYVVTVRQASTVVQAHTVPASSLSCNITGLISGNYTMSVAAVGPMTRSGEVSINVSINGPPTPEACAVHSSIDSVTLVPSNARNGLNSGFYEFFYSINPKATAAGAQYLGQGLSFTHAGLAFSTIYYYFIRSVNAYGKSDFLYVPATTSNDVSTYLQAIAGKVEKSALGKELAADIELITGIGPGSVNERLDEAKALADEARVRLGQQIAAVDTELEGVKNELKGQIDAIADLADSMPYKPDQTYAVGQGVLGADGVIYQAVKDVPVNTPPPNTTYWLNVGQAVVTANGLAARVQTVETKVTSVEGVNTAQAQQITGLRTDVDGKASASSVQSIGNRVTTAENSISSQGSALTGLNNSLNTTNTNVSTAQTAANNAATLAGSKGKVLVQSAAPTAAEQLAQNLWIDITGGANTPKRWNGSTWAAVTDKVATDAAAAAASAMTLAQTKADASAVTALTSRVTATEGSITSLSSNVVSLGNSITAANVAGSNIIPNASFDPSYNQMGFAVVASSSAGVPASCPFKYVARLASRDHVPLISVVPYTPAKPGDVWRVSALVACGAGAAPFNFYFNRGSDPSTYAAVGNGAGNVTPTTTWTRASWDYTVPAGTFFIQPFLQIEQPHGGSGTVWYVTDWRVENISAAKAAQATADAASSAVSSLTSTVGQQGAAITSISSNIVNLTNSVGNAGGENLVWNPDFNKAAGVANDLPDGYDADGPGNAGASTGVFALVPSFMNSAEKAQRITVTGIDTSALYRSIRNSRTRTPKVSEGQAVCSSINVMGTAGLGFRIFMQQLNASGALITTTPSDLTILNGSAQRVFLTIPVLAAGVTQIVMFYRVYGGTSVTSGFIDMARPQVEYGIVPTGWKNNGQVEVLAQSATSNAVDALTSTITTQGSTITSVAGRTTALENTVNSPANGLPTKASASAVTDLTTRVSSAEGAITTQSSDITVLKNSINAAGSFVAGVSWEFTGSNRGWVALTSGATMTPGALYSTVSKYTNVQISGIAVSGAENPFVRFRFRRKNTSRPNGAMYWANEDGGLAEVRRANFPITGSEDWQDVEIDLSGNSGWNGKAINTIRLDFSNSNDASMVVDLGYVALGRKSAAASAQAVSSIDAKVTQQGATLTSQATQVASLQTAVGNANTAIQTEITARTNADTALGRRIDTVQSSVGSANALIQSESSTRANADAALGRRVDTVQSSLGDTNASVQQTSTALAGLNGQVNAQYSVKVMTTSSGMKVAAGFGLGLESEGGVTQSTFAVSADRFVVLNANLGGGATLSSPFTIENGQVFIADAYIKKATIQQGIVGQGLYSQTFTNYGAPVMNVDFNAGQILIQNRTTNGAYMFIRQDGIFMVQNGVVVVELSMG
ncbi:MULTISPECIES: phage tail tip fiber protein [Pseudomonas]|uniref:phage tail tip fiber protein n=1 Tax=Pseudomonas TaxID=286 RepID=UPI0035E45A74